MIIPAGANLMGSDLYNHLIRYFAVHLKSLREVRTGMVMLLRASVLTYSPRMPMYYKMRHCSSFMPKSGIATQQGPTISTVSLHISIDTG